MHSILCSKMCVLRFTPILCPEPLPKGTGAVLTLGEGLNVVYSLPGMASKGSPLWKNSEFLNVLGCCFCFINLFCVIFETHLLKKLNISLKSLIYSTEGANKGFLSLTLRKETYRTLASFWPWWLNHSSPYPACYTYGVLSQSGTLWWALILFFFKLPPAWCRRWKPAPM